MNSAIIPRTIDELNWPEIGKQTSRMRGLTSAQRDNNYFNSLEETPEIQTEPAADFFELVDSLYRCREFHESVGLSYYDPNNENGQIIRVALLLSLIQKSFRE